MGRVGTGVSRGYPEPQRVTGSFPARGDPARAFPPRAPPGYLFSGDAEHAKPRGAVQGGNPMAADGDDGSRGFS